MAKLNQISILIVAFSSLFSISPERIFTQDANITPPDSAKTSTAQDSSEAQSSAQPLESSEKKFCNRDWKLKIGLQLAV